MSLHLICLSPIIVLLLWVRLPLWARSTTLCDQVGQWLATGRWFSPGPSTNKTDRHHITEILLRVALNTIKPTQTIHLLLNTRDMWVSEWVIVVKRKVDILFSYINGEDKLHFNEMMMSTLYKANTNTLSCICLVLAHWNKWMVWVGFMVFNATFNNISVIWWRSVLLVDGPGENHRPVASHWPTWSHNVVLLAQSRSRTHNNSTIIGDRQIKWRLFLFRLNQELYDISVTFNLTEQNDICVGFSTSSTI
jgi:hypothetical protein